MSKKNQRGATLAETFVGTAVLFICLGVLGFGTRTCMSGDEVEHDAEGEVRQYAAKLGIVIDKAPNGHAAIACGNIATKKGLVGCTYKSGGVTHQLECVGRYSVGHGCRDQKLSVPQPGQREEE